MVSDNNSKVGTRTGEEMPSTTVLVTGATGLIGQRLLELLSSLGSYRVKVLALPGTEEVVPKLDRIEVLSGDLLDETTLLPAVQDVELVFHMAALLPGTAYDDLMKVNVYGTDNLLRACARAGTVRRFVFASSVAVYGSAFSPQEWPVAEDSPKEPGGNETLRNYGRSKLSAERVVTRYCAANDIEYVILRPSTVYGRGGDVHNYAEEMVQNVLSNSNAGQGAGAQISMQMVHVDDVVEVIVQAGTQKDAAGEAFNIAGSEVATGAYISEMIRTLAQGMDYTTSADGVRVYDIDKAQDLLEFIPRVSLTEGFEELVAAHLAGAG